MTDAETHREALASVWRDFARVEAGTYSPLYAAIARFVADDRELLELVRHAPPHAHLPLSLLASAHDLLLSGVQHPLAAVYAGTSSDAPGPLFRDLCLAHRDAIVEVMATRRIQTNECGRSATIALGLGEVAATVGTPEVLVDAGASAGLNLLYDRYHLDYGPLGALGDVTSPVHAPCEVAGDGLFPPATPDIPVRVGIDRSPVDASDERQARWLLACVWPDTGRLDRTAAALAIAAAAPPDVRRGELTSDLARIAGGIGGGGLVCVVTSAATGYLSGSERKAFVAQLTELGAHRATVWLSFEGAGVVGSFPRPRMPTDYVTMPMVMGIACFGVAGDRAVARAITHPHGASLAWLPPR
jgi:hypothetical protein